MSPCPSRSVTAADGAQAGQPLDEAAADLALRATRYLRTRFRDRVTIGDLSTHLAYSPSHLTRVFTAAVGTSPMDYLAAWRLHEAKHLLVTHRLGVAETCHEVGYTSVGTFSRRFLRDVGTPPAGGWEDPRPSAGPRGNAPRARTGPLAMGRDLSPAGSQRAAGHRDTAPTHR